MCYVDSSFPGPIFFCTEDGVPLWRDGNSGKELQKAMVSVAATRLFEFGILDQSTLTGGKSAFSSGAAWCGYARLNGPPSHHLDTIMEKLFDTKDRWTDSVKSLNRSIWAGEHDVEIMRMSHLFPATMDGQPMQLQKRISEMFPPIITLLQQRDTEASRLVTEADKAAELEKERKQVEDEAKNEKDAPPKNPDVIADGDVTADLFSDQDAAGKRSLCEALNLDAKKRQSKSLEKSLHAASAEVLRTRVVVVDTVASAKTFMESCCKEGLRNRLVYVDWTQFGALQAKG